MVKYTGSFKSFDKTATKDGYERWLSMDVINLLNDAVKCNQFHRSDNEGFS